MEIFSILADVIFESIKWLPSREVDKKKTRLYGSLLLSVAMAIGVGISSYFVIDSFYNGLLFKSYFWIGIVVNAITAVSVGLIIIQLWTWGVNPHVYESENFIKSEIHSLINFLILSLIPGFHVIFLPRVISNASHIFEYADSSSESQQYRKVASNIIAISALIILIYTIVIGLYLVIAGDTRRI